MHIAVTQLAPRQQPEIVSAVEGQDSLASLLTTAFAHCCSLLLLTAAAHCCCSLLLTAHCWRQPIFQFFTLGKQPHCFAWVQVSSYRSRADVISAMLTSSHIPLWFDGESLHGCATGPIPWRLQAGARR